MTVVDLERVNGLSEAELDALAQRLEARRRAPTAPAPLVNARGEVISPLAAAGRVQVAPGQTIASTWGNLTYGQTINVFASTADRDQQWPAPADGAMCYTADTGSLWLRRAGVWTIQNGDVARIPVAGGIGYTNGWSDAGAPNVVGSYRRIGTRVYLGGQIKGGTLAAPAFTLPVGYRPAGNVAFATSSNGAFTNIVITAAGAVQINVGNNVGPALDVAQFDTI